MSLVSVHFVFFSCEEHHYILNFVLDEKAIHFIQAEKIYYESALIDTTDIQMKLGMFTQIWKKGRCIYDEYIFFQPLNYSVNCPLLTLHLECLLRNPFT